MLLALHLNQWGTRSCIMPKTDSSRMPSIVHPMQLFPQTCAFPCIISLVRHSLIAPLGIHLLALLASQKSSSCGWAALAEMIRLRSDCGRPHTWSRVASGNPDCDECAHSPSLPNPVINGFGLTNTNFVTHCMTLAHGPAKSDWAGLKHETSGCALCPLSSRSPMSFWTDACGSSSILVFGSPIVDPVECDKLMSVCSPCTPGELGENYEMHKHASALDHNGAHAEQIERLPVKAATAPEQQLQATSTPAMRDIRHSAPCNRFPLERNPPTHQFSHTHACAFSVLAQFPSA